MSILEFLNTEQLFSIPINIEAEHIAFLRQGSRKLRSSTVARHPLKNSYLSPRSITSIIFILFIFKQFYFAYVLIWWQYRGLCDVEKL